jgi:amino acid transporter
MARDGELPRVLAHIDPKRRIPTRATLFVAATTLVTSLLLVDRLELALSMVSFGALLGFLCLQVSVVAHFIRRERSRNWLLYLVTPVIGFLIIGYVLINADSNAKLAGGAWMAAGIIVFLSVRNASSLRNAALGSEET